VCWIKRSFSITNNACKGEGLMYAKAACLDLVIPKGSRRRSEIRQRDWRITSEASMGPLSTCRVCEDRYGGEHRSKAAKKNRTTERF
jgi:hypothetical protein